METKDAVKAIKIIAKIYPTWPEPIVTQFGRATNAPFKVLISTIISQRTKDDVTGEASHRLFQKAATVRTMLKLSKKELTELIYPCGFYKTKADTILKVCAELLGRFKGKVPDEIDELITLPGVGRKTANLVLTIGFRKLGICVDTHVHRISNRFGYVQTKTPEETEFALREKLPRKHWIEYNDFLVAFGQNLCRPIGPHCDECPVAELCDQVDVQPRKGK